MFLSRVTLTAAVFATALSSTVHAEPRSKSFGPVHKPSKNSATEDFADNSKMTVNTDVCTVAVMHHSRKIYQSLSQTENRLKALIGQSSGKSNVEWVEKPQLGRKGAKDKIETALRTIAAAKNQVAEFAGRGKHYGSSNLVAQNRCEEKMILGDKKDPGMVQQTQSLLEAAQAQVQQLFDNEYITMHGTNFEGYSESFMAPIFEAHQQADKLAMGLTTKRSNEKQKAEVTKLESSLRAKYPNAFNAQKQSEKEKIAVNKAISAFIQSHDLSYGDAANLWRNGVVRDVPFKTSQANSGAFVDDQIIDRLSP